VIAGTFLTDALREGFAHRGHAPHSRAAGPHRIGEIEMRINTAARGFVMPEAIDTADLAATDTTLVGTTAGQVVGTAQTPSYTAMNNAVRDSVLGTGAIVGVYTDGTEASDTIYGTERADTLHGNGGNDVIHGGNGDDQLYGGADNDGLDGGAGADLLNGGTGSDTASYVGSAHGVTVDLAAGMGFGGYAEGDTYVSIENVMGTSQADVILGNAADNVLNGGDGNDQIVGGAGRDTIIGGNGYDTLTGDTTGIMMADTFVFTAFSGGAYITDFQQDLDKIQLSGFTPDALGADHGLAWGNGDTSRGLSADDTVYYNTETHTLYQIETKAGTDGNVRIFYVAEIATVGDDVYRLQTDDLIFI
jgi:serralysin